MKRSKRIVVYVGIILLSVIVFTGVSYVYNRFICKDRYLVNINLKFDPNNNLTYKQIGEKYENIINLYNAKEKKEALVDRSLENFKGEWDLDKVIISPMVGAREISIQYIAKNKDKGTEIVNDIANEIIRNNNAFMVNNKAKLEKYDFSINEKAIISIKHYNILICTIWGAALGIGIVMILEAKCYLLKKK